ncbi:MAG: hypothetical protein VST68_01050 [Nitrospirota bacterium]|nr:hypothetical protein [Nitrospirota bacterium]
MSPAQSQGRQDAFSTGKAAASLARGAYSQYVSAKVAKSDKFVSRRRQKGENATGGFFQHSLKL